MLSELYETESGGVSGESRMGAEGARYFYTESLRQKDGADFFFYMYMSVYILEPMREISCGSFFVLREKQYIILGGHILCRKHY